MSERNAILFGAGKIARGFIAHLLTLSGYRITFIEKNPQLVDLLRSRGHYTIHIMGAPEKNRTIREFTVFSTEERDQVAAAISDAGVVFVSVGGPNSRKSPPCLPKESLCVSRARTRKH